MTYKIVSDSSSNVFEMEGVNYTTVPLKISVAGKNYVDQKGVDVEEMINLLMSTNDKSSTSCPSIGEWIDAFEGSDEIYAITISSNLSGSYNSANKAKESYLEENPSAKIMVIDSLSTGAEMELIIEHIAECKEKGYDFARTEVEVNIYRKKLQLLFNLQNVMNLANNGRLNPVIAKLIGVLGIRLVGEANEEGRIDVIHKAKGEKHALKKIFERMLEKGYNGGKVRINHVINSESAQMVVNMIREKFPTADIKVRLTTALCSYYAEKGGLLLGYEID